MEAIVEVNKITIALIGNPNSGKTSLFNQLTGLNQKIGNYPGVTVDKKTGRFRLDRMTECIAVDLPGSYSIYPRSLDERVVTDVLLDSNNSLYPDAVVVVVDSSTLKRNLLLLTQIRDLGIPTICALNMGDVALRRGISLDLEKLQEALRVPVLAINARTGEGVGKVKQALSDYVLNKELKGYENGYTTSITPELVSRLRSIKQTRSEYYYDLLLAQTETIAGITSEDREHVRKLKAEFHSQLHGLQQKDVLQRYRQIDDTLKQTVRPPEDGKGKRFSDHIDKFVTHRIFGYLTFLLILLLIFQAIFQWAEIPMSWIDARFADLSVWVKGTFPSGVFVNMISEGIVPGIGGIFIFIPQIALLFGFISILEETGYMARVVFLMDRIMRKFGLSGKSVVPLISGVACAIPAVMATRNIENWKERITTIMVTPLMTCSARLPVYVILIALVVPPSAAMGVFNLQGLTLLGLYALGFLAALLAGAIFKQVLKTDEPSYLIMEMPAYKVPRWGNVGMTMLEKSKTFVFHAGKIILAVSLVLWVLASHGPSDRIKNAESYVKKENPSMSENDLKTAIQTYKLENSYAAVMGKWMEPAIKPLGYDWKIGIALITSFAAREVFVSTIATIYSVGGDPENPETIRQKLAREKNVLTGQKAFNMATGFSLMIFYAFAMQCMSTLAIVYRETKGWKWPVIQFVYMSIMAYAFSFVTYQIVLRFM